MQSLQQSYTAYFNRRHDKVGHLFQGRYRAILCDRDSYLLALVRYIHLNPVRAGLVSRPEEYPHSGHRAYLRGDDTELLDTSLVFRILGGPAAYRRFVGEAADEGHRVDYYPATDRVAGSTPAGTTASPVASASRTPAASSAVAAEPAGPASLVAGRDGSAARRAARRSDGPPPDGAGAHGNVATALADRARRWGVTADLLRGAARGRAVSETRARVAYELVRDLGYPLGAVATALGAIRRH